MPLQLIVDFKFWSEWDHKEKNPTKKKKREKPLKIKMKHYEEQFWFISLVSVYPGSYYVLFPKAISDAEKMEAILQHKDH